MHELNKILQRMRKKEKEQVHVTITLDQEAKELMNKAMRKVGIHKIHGAVSAFVREAVKFYLNNIKQQNIMMLQEEDMHDDELNI